MPKYSDLAGHQFGAFDGHYPHFCHLLRLLRVVRSSERKQANEIEPKIGNQGGFYHFLSLDAILLLWKEVAAIERAECLRGTQILSLVIPP